MTTRQQSSKTFAGDVVGAGVMRLMAFGVAVLTAVTLVVWGVMAEVFARTPEQVFAVTVAAGICWSAAIPGLALFVLRNDADWGMMAAGLAMVFRLIICLGVIASFLVVRHPLLNAGVAEMMVVFYLATVAAETGLFVGISKRWPAGGPGVKAGPSAAGLKVSDK
jgi:hypothetical protein